MSRPHIVFVTGRLAEASLRRQVDELAPRLGFDYSVAVLPITVAALATTSWIANHLSLPIQADRLIFPGLCRGEPGPLQDKLPGVTIERGPEDLRDLPDFFGASPKPVDYGKHDLQILAEINHAPRLRWPDLLHQARSYREDGADLIDLGCDPGDPWPGVGECVRMLREEGFRVSIDSFHPAEVEAAIRSGAELVLSVNSTNCHLACSWGCEVVAIPDEPSNLASLDATIERLDADGVRYRLDPILEPIGFGFAASLGRYLDVRRRYPLVEMMMGVGNLTELTEVDSTGVNALLAGFCQETGIRSVLTTQVINWCRSCVKELDLARRLMHYAVTQRTVPKKVDSRLVQLRDAKLRSFGEAELDALKEQVKDRNFRLFAEEGEIHVLNADMHLRGEDPFELFEQMLQHSAIDAAHAFYLGYEMAKAVTALTLGKNYTQDQALRWGFLTREERSHRGGKEAE